MIKREDYLNDLELIDQYHQQLNGHSFLLKTPIKEWDKLPQCSTRLRNTLLHFRQFGSNGQIDYLCGGKY